MADGSVIIGVDLDVKKADKDLAKLKKEIESTESAIGEQEAKKSPLVARAERLNQEMKQARAEVERYKQAWISGVVGADTQQARAQERLNSITGEYEKIEAEIGKIDTKLLPAYEKLDRMKEEAGALQQNINQAAKNTRKMEKATKKADKRMGIFATRLRGILLSAFVFNIMSAGFRELTEWMGNVVKSNDEARAAISRLKGALLTLVQPLVSVVVPAFTEFLNILTSAASVLAQLVALLFGTTAESASESANALYDEMKAIEGVGEAANKAEGQLASFDEINRLTGSSANKVNDIIAPDFSGLSFAKIPEWLTELTVTMHDILFEWDDLTAEDVLKKIVTSLIAIAGAVIGFSVGGVGGAVIGMTIGASLGAAISSLTFDGNGKVDTEELLKSLCTALLSITGAIIGFTVGGVGGAAIGVVVGASVGADIGNLLFDGDGKVNREELLKSLCTALGAIVGGVLGFSVGGIGGAAIGVSVGAYATAGLVDIFFDNDGVVNDTEVLKTLCTALSALVGGVIGFAVGGPLGAVVGVLAGAGVSMALSTVDFNSVSGSSVKRAILDSLVSALYIIAGGAIGFAVGNVPGAIIGMVVGAILTISLKEVKFDRNGNLSKWGDLDLRGGSVGAGRMSLTSYSIPKLATGAVIPPNREFMAVLGDQKSGTNIEAPLSTIEQAVENVMNRRGDSGGDIRVELYLDGKKLAANQVKHINNMTRAAGKSVILV